MRLFKARAFMELGQVVSGSATQGLWLENRKTGSQEVGEDPSKLHWRWTVVEVMGGGRCEEKLATERRRAYTDFGERDEHLVCHALALTMVMIDEA